MVTKKCIDNQSVLVLSPSDGMDRKLVQISASVSVATR